MTVTSRLHRQKGKERQRKTEENVERRPVVAPRYESGGEAQAPVRPARRFIADLCLFFFSFHLARVDFGARSLSRSENGGTGDRVCLCLLAPPLNHGGPQPSARRGQCVCEAQALPRNLSCLAGARCGCTHSARPRAACLLAHVPAHT